MTPFCTRPAITIDDALAPHPFYRSGEPLASHSRRQHIGVGFDGNRFVGGEQVFEKAGFEAGRVLFDGAGVFHAWMRMDLLETSERLVPVGEEFAGSFAERQSIVPFKNDAQELLIHFSRD